MSTKSDEYSSSYSESSFWQKLSKYAKAAGYELVEKALWLYYAAQDPDTPLKAKAIIYSALGYFILPLDVVPDIAPVIGYSDDLAVLAAALATIAIHINANVKAQADQKLLNWFG